MTSSEKGFAAQPPHFSRHVLCGLLAGFSALGAAQPALAITTSKVNLDTAPYSTASPVGMSPIALARNSAGDFVAAWSGPAGTTLQAFSADGTAKGPATTVPSGPFYSGKVAISDNGDIAAAWVQSTTPASGSFTASVMLQRFDATGAPIGATTTITTGTYPYNKPALLFHLSDSVDLGPVAMNGTGDIAVTWSVVQYKESCLAGTQPGCVWLPSWMSSKSYATLEKAGGTETGPLQIDSVPTVPANGGFIDSPLAITLASNDGLSVLFSGAATQSTPGPFLRRYSSKLLATGGKTPLMFAGGWPAGVYQVELQGQFDANGNCYVLSDSSTSVVLSKFDTTGALLGNVVPDLHTNLGPDVLAVSANGDVALANSPTFATFVTTYQQATLQLQLFDAGLAPIGTVLTLDSGLMVVSPSLLAGDGEGNFVEIAGEVAATLDSTTLAGLLVQQ